MKLNFVIFFIGICALSSCVHSHKVEGSREKEELPAGFRVGIGGKEVKEGETLNVLKAFCKSINPNRGRIAKKCSDQKVGEALILRIVDHDSAIVKAMDGFVMDNSMTVEKQ